MANDVHVGLNLAAFRAFRVPQCLFTVETIFVTFAMSSCTFTVQLSAAKLVI